MYFSHELNSLSIFQFNIYTMKYLKKFESVINISIQDIIDIFQDTQDIDGINVSVDYKEDSRVIIINIVSTRLIPNEGYFPFTESQLLIIDDCKSHLERYLNNTNYTSSDYFVYKGWYTIIEISQQRRKPDLNPNLSYTHQ